MIILLTSGPWPTQYKDTWTSVARQLSQNGVGIYAVGIGSSVDRTQLNDVAENTYVGSDFSFVTPDLDYDIRTGKMYNFESIICESPRTLRLPTNAL